jgi:outer membrane protein assembly factor BamD (BamD/ComL family)
MMSKLLALGAIALAFSACAHRPGESASTEEQLRLGISALERGDFATATSTLQAIADQSPNSAAGRHALLALVAAAMDPRNPNRAEAASAGLAARYLGLTQDPDWTKPVAEALYLLALDQGATDSARVEAETDAQKARAETRRVLNQARAGTLPSLPGGPSAGSRLKSLEQERDKLAARVKQLEQ